MILELQHIYKNYDQDKLVVPVLRMSHSRLMRESTWQSWGRRAPARPLS